MAVRINSWLSLPSLLRTLAAQVRLSLRLVREPAVPALLKLIPFVALAYVVSPIDGMPDLVPVLGQLDDLGVVLVALQAFHRLCPDRVVAHHQSALASSQPYAPAPPYADAGAGRPSTGPVIDAEFRRDDRP